MNILVTGGTGFIGSHLCETLLARNHQVTLLVKPNDDNRWIDSLPLSRIIADITDKSALPAAVKDVDYVFHLAAALSANDPQEYYRVNVDGTRNLLKACLESPRPPQRFLLVSSVAAMGPSGKHNTYSEDTPCRPISDYGKSKWQAEQELHHLNGILPWTIVRLPLVYGPRSKGGLYSLVRLVNRGIKLLVGNGQTNVAYVTDIVDGLIAAIESPNTVGQTYLLGEKHPYSMKEVTDAMARAMNKRAITIWLPLQILYLVSPFSELVGRLRHRVPLIRFRNIAYLKHRYWRVDTSKAERDLGYISRVPLQEGLARTARWYTDQHLL